MKFYSLPLLLTASICFGMDQMDQREIEISNKTNDAFKWRMFGSYYREGMDKPVVVFDPFLSGTLMSGETAKKVVNVREGYAFSVSAKPCPTVIVTRRENNYASCNIDLSGQLVFYITKGPYDRFAVKQAIN
jgi:hypothetical protein